MKFENEQAFEDALIEVLKKHGWDCEPHQNAVLKHPTEKDLINNWASIISENNRDIDRLNDIPLTDTEMAQILEQVTSLKTPLKLNSFINGKTITIKRDNKADTLHYGKEVSLKIYDPREISAGQSVYQIAQQPHFSTAHKLVGERRGDLMLLINGMPLIHVELKRSGVPVSQAVNQINKYLHEGVFTGIFSLIQVFVAMSPEETVYFASPGTGGKVNERFCFHWANFNNEPQNDWKYIATNFLNIPMAHQLIGYYTVADDADGVLKVMRSYQYFAASSISDKVAKVNAQKHWGLPGVRGGYIWHTTGSGKTMTSFKSAQLIARSKDADKVIFLMDRIELGTQSLREYRAFAEADDSVQGTENTAELRAKLKSNSPNDVLIVTSIQKMSRIKDDSDGMNTADLAQMQDKRMVFIIDECHRSTFGDMLKTIKDTFPKALYFGFTGTPIQEENSKRLSTTSDVFGDELHRYSIADGIRDGNVLGFDPYMVCTMRDAEVREAVACEKAKAKSREEVWADEQKSEVYSYWMNPSQISMEEINTADGEEKHGIEHYLKRVQYEERTHRDQVVTDILSSHPRLSRGNKFHGVFATSSISDAIDYFRMFVQRAPHLKITALFDPHIDNSGDKAISKEEGLIEIIEHYNKMYKKEFTLPTHDAMKRDIAARLAHKKPYLSIERNPEERLDILIVVDQMLTGFDSKWINVLYLDKVIEYELLIQAFSRTNRLFAGDEKPFGIIRYYRKPHTMRQNIERAVKLYSGDRPFGLFANKLLSNMEMCNSLFKQMVLLFEADDIRDFNRLPEGQAARGKFASLFNEFHGYLEACKIQGFTLGMTYVLGEFDPDVDARESLEVVFNEQQINALIQRYKELRGKSDGPKPPDVPYDIKGYLIDIDTGLIDNRYMNENFTKWHKALEQGNVSSEELETLFENLHRSFASLSQENQRFAELFIHDIQMGNVDVEPGMTLRDYITQYAKRAQNNQLDKLVDALGVNRERVELLLKMNINEGNINDFGRFDDLKQTVDRTKAQAYFEEKEGAALPPYKIPMRIDALLRRFLIQGGFDL